MSIADLNEFTISKIGWCVESDFKRDCGGFKLTLKNGMESPWCSIESKVEGFKESQFTGMRTVELNTRMTKSTLHLLDETGNTFVKLLSKQPLPIEWKDEQIIGFYGQQTAIAEEFYEGPAI